MRPVTVTVGPLASASVNNICTSQTPSAGKALVLNGTLVTGTFVGTGSIAGNVLTISAVTSGVLNIGDLVSGSGVLPNTYIIGLGPSTTNGTGTYVLSALQQTVSSTTIYCNRVATLDTPRRVLLTPAGNESSNTFTITGTGWSNEVVTEVLTGGNAAATYTNMDFRTVTQIVATNTAASTLTIGTNGVGSSMWVRMDEWALPANSVQATVSGTVNYTVEQSIQDEAALPYLRAWVAEGISAATTSMIASFAYAPIYGRVTLNSGSGSLSATFSQSGVAPY